MTAAARRPRRLARVAPWFGAMSLLACAASRPALSPADPGPAPATGPANARHAEVDSVHPHLLADLAPDGAFPRFSAAELAVSGYPDHLHAFFWPDWQPPIDAKGLPYGPGSLCSAGAPRARSDLLVSPGRVAHGPLVLLHDPAYRPCDLMLYVELADWARARCRTLLGIEPAETLYVVNPNTLKDYERLTGYGSWRLYRFRPDTCVIEPVPVLTARTLAAHVAVETAVLHALAEATGDNLPVWLRQGLAAYIADMGVHLNNFMAMYRLEGSVLMTPAAIDSALLVPPDSDAQRDQKRFRCASHGSFLMAWRLVEHLGGLRPVRDLIAAVAGGETFASACRRIYGADPAELAARLDPTTSSQPLGDEPRPVQPAFPPGASRR